MVELNVCLRREKPIPRSVEQITTNRPQSPRLEQVEFSASVESYRKVGRYELSSPGGDFITLHPYIPPLLLPRPETVVSGITSPSRYAHIS